MIGCFCGLVSFFGVVLIDKLLILNVIAGSSESSTVVILSNTTAGGVCNNKEGYGNVGGGEVLCVISFVFGCLLPDLWLGFGDILLERLFFVISAGTSCVVCSNCLLISVELFVDDSEMTLIEGSSSFCISEVILIG